ncbi:MAG: twin-arginine translocase subunit TatC [Alloprevotella sp.]|nr:twin-arginine translocase subunit TatC [Alloprevotella sp.]
MTFWDHLDELRGVLLRSALLATVFAVAAFCLKDALFAFLLAPTHGDFVTYRLLEGNVFQLHLINTGITEQFMTHMRAACYMGLLCASPYMLYALFRFVAPGLYETERRVAWWALGSAYVMFLAGTAINYLLVFPLAVRFLGTYSVSSDVTNMLTLQSYMDTLLGMTLAMGICFELPVVCWVLGRLGLLTAEHMRLYRRHVFVGILLAAAIITPTGDPLTLFLVAIPLYLLYELSMLIVRSR